MADVNERIILSTAIRGARTIVTPFQVEILQGDQLVVKHLGSTILPQPPGVDLQISFRQLSAGEVTSSRYLVPVTNDGIIHTTEIPLASGYLMSLAAHPIFSVLQGSFWCQASISRKSGTEELFLMPLIQGFPSRAQVLAWPGSPLMSQADGQWFPRTITLTPAAGVEWTSSVPQYAQWQVISAAAVFSTSATVADRLFRLELQNFFGSGLFRTLFSPAQPASSARVYAFGRGTPHASALTNDTWVDALPNDMILIGGHRVGVRVAGIQVDDTWSQTLVSVLERLAFI